MRIRESVPVVPTSRTYFREMVMEARRDLEADYQTCEIGHDDYYFRMHSLKRMLK